MRVYIIGGFLIGIVGSIAYSAYSTIKEQQEKEMNELPFSEEVIAEEIETDF